MKAAVLHGIGDIRVEKVPKPEISDDEVLIGVKAAGIYGRLRPRLFLGTSFLEPLPRSAKTRKASR